MKQKEFNRLNAIILKLTRSEILTTVDSLKKIRSTNKLEKQKLLRLFKLILTNKMADARVIKDILYKRDAQSAFNKLVQRLTEKILEVILYKENIIKNNIYDKRAKEIFLFREKLLQFDMLILRGINYDYLSVIDKIIKKAEKFEYYDILVLALIKKRSLIGFRKNKKQYNQINKKIQHYEICRDAFNKAGNYYHSLSEELSTTQDKVLLIEKLPDYILELQIDYEITKSKLILLYKMYLQSFLYEKRGLYLEKYLTHRKILKLLRENEFICSHLRMGGALINLAISELMLFKFNDALKDTLSALEYSKYVSNNSAIFREVLFLIKFYRSELISATLEIEKLIAQSFDSKQAAYFINKRLYYYACLKSIDRDFTKSNKSLTKLSIIDKDKEGWNIAIRILSIINQIEMEKWDLAEHLIDNLRKHVERIRDNQGLSKRYLVIQQVLFDLARRSFDFKKTHLAKNSDFKLLESKNPDFHWKIGSSELIVFEEWFNAKLTGENYNHKKVMELMREKYAPMNLELETV